MAAKGNGLRYRGGECVAVVVEDVVEGEMESEIDVGRMGVEGLWWSDEGL